MAELSPLIAELKAKAQLSTRYGARSKCRRWDEHVCWRAATALEEALDALKPFEEAERQAWELSTGGHGSLRTLAILKHIAFNFIEWPHLARARTVRQSLLANHEDLK